MDFEQSFTQVQKNTTDSGPPIGCFNCNICLDFAHEPIVTLCGHLYCWPCIYKWLHVQSSSSLASDEHPQCPVCKSELSHQEMVPLYGKGLPSSKDLQTKSSRREMLVPPRPAGPLSRTLNPSPQTGQQLPYRNPYRTDHYNLSYDADSSLSPLVNFETAGFQQSMVGIFGDMFYASIFGTSEGIYRYPSSYQFVRGNGSRRQEIQADRSLNRISIFLFCCFVLCLVVF